MSLDADGKKWAADRTLTPAQEAALRVKADKHRRDEKREKQIGAEMRRRIEELETAIGVALDLSTPRAASAVTGRRSHGSKQACPILVASDWHVEERVVPGHVNGLNEYGPAIAKKRAERFVDGALWLIETNRAGARIDECVLALLGDFITGWIHEELQSGNAMAPTEATEYALDLLRGVIDALLKRGGLKRLRVVCTRGNHGRITKKTYINAAARLSYEWLMYRILARFYDGDSRVTFAIEDGYHTLVPVFDKVVRFHHGDAVSYQGGVGGITIPLRKKIARWNQGRRATLDVMGHFHQLLYGGDFVVNGSLIGWNDYATWIGASPEPPQQAFVLIRPERGVSTFAPIFVTE